MAAAQGPRNPAPPPPRDRRLLGHACTALAAFLRAGKPCPKASDKHTESAFRARLSLQNPSSTPSSKTTLSLAGDVNQRTTSVPPGEKRPERLNIF